MGVYIPYTSYDYTQMQGPAPSGFHVPTKDEWVALCGILTSTFGMARNATTLGTYLKMPMAGDRDYGDADVYSVGSNCYYWSSTPYDANNAYYLNFYSSNIKPQSYGRRSYGFSVRCFKNSPTVPTSSWTILYQGSGNAGVFYNSTDGLISVSGDGTTWYTIQDKNLGATTVYNQGDTLTDANCGYYYQWGNNYGFPHSGSVTTSSTKVDASNYGPGNYYSSNTFITVSASPYDWSSVQNDNLWGDTTGVKPMSELKNAYIGEVYEYSYDFRNKTESQIINDGWTKAGGSLTTGSSGISSPSGYDFTLTYPIDLSSANKITLNADASYNRNYGGYAVVFGVQESVSDYRSNNIAMFYCASSTGYNGTNVRLAQSGNIIGGTNIGDIGTGAKSPTIEIDLQNKTITGKIAGFNNSTLSLSDAQVSLIRSLGALFVYTTQNTFYIQTISVTIE